MFKILITTTFFLITTLTWAQNVVTDTSATVAGYWKKNDKTKLQLTSTKERYKNGILQSTNTSTTIIDVWVKSATATSYIINWKYGATKMDDNSDNPLVKKLLKLNEGLEVTFQTDELGIFEQLLNWKEIQNHMYKAIDLMAKEFDSKEAQGAIKEIKKLYATRESIEETVIKDVQLYHTIYGLEYKLDEKLVIETELPNILGGDPFPGTMEVQMTELHPNENTCKIEMILALNEEKATAIIQAWMNAINPSIDKLPIIQINDLNEFDVELITGWLSRAYCKRIAVTDGQKNIEITEIKRL